MSRGSLLADIAKFDTRCLGNVEDRPLASEAPKAPEKQNIGKEKCSQELILHDKDDRSEYQDDSEALNEKLEALATAWRNTGTAVVFTGAGISTAASLPDYRGPNGIWTKKDQAIRSGSEEPEAKTSFITLECAEPTFSHKALLKLPISAIITTNVDGLHEKAQREEEDESSKHLDIINLHGSIFKEKCENCGKLYERDFDVRNDAEKNSLNFRLERKVVTSPDDCKSGNANSGRDHSTGRVCECCKGALKDTIVHFQEFIDDEVREKAGRVSWHAQLCIVIGSSMRVSPANSLPLFSVRKNSGSLFIINKQKTPFEKEAGVTTIHSDSDQVMRLLLEKMRS